MPPPSGPAVEVLRLLPFAAAAALQRVAVGRGEGEALSVRLEIPVARSGRYPPRRASEVRAILSSGGPPRGEAGMPRAL